MAHKIYIGIDNGTTGTIGILGLPSGPRMITPPVKKEQNYTKVAKNITRIDFPAFEKQLLEVLFDGAPPFNESEILVILERPFVNPGMFNTSIISVRALEATLIVIECLGLAHMYCDSRGWQKALLPEGLKGSPALKKASRDIGLRLFPSLEFAINKHKDADGLLIAEWARREGY